MCSTGMLNYSMTISSFFLSVFSILITCILTKNFIIHLFCTLKWSIFSFYFFREQVSAFPGLFLTINPFEIFISICLCLGELMAKLAPCLCSSLGLCPFIHHLTTSLGILTRLLLASVNRGESRCCVQWVREHSHCSS